MPRESTNGIYAGAFSRTMDAKNRVTIPSEWLREDGGQFFLLPAASNISVMPAEELARKEDDLREMKLSGPVFQEALRRIYGSTRCVEPDKQGRILLPEEFCRRAELSGEVTFIGVKNRFEIWSAAKRSIAADETPALSEEARQALEALGL